MSDTTELLQRIAALRSRLDTHAEPSSIEDKVQRGTVHNALIESTLRSASPSDAVQVPATLRLTGRGARLLRKGRDLLQALRTIADDSQYQQAEDLIHGCHREAVAMIEVVLRSVQALPASISAQLRMCDGLEIVLGEVEDRITLLNGNLSKRKRTAGRIDELADYLRRLASLQPVSLTPLQMLADVIVDEAKAGQPLRFLGASPIDPSRFAAAHCLNVAQVLARLLLDDVEWQPQLQLAIMTALVHDVGMTRVPADILLKQGPLDSDQRRLIEKHTRIAEGMLTPLWPGGGWPIEAAKCHHERNDGTGYPAGHREMNLSSIVRLVAVCDVYAALCAPRPYRPAFDTRTALTETLMLAERDYLDKPSAERLLVLSFYPVGSTVELNDGTVGQVIATQRGADALTHPDRPIVYVASDAQGQSFDWPRVVDLLEHKDRSILRSVNTDERRTLPMKKFCI